MAAGLRGNRIRRKHYPILATAVVLALCLSHLWGCSSSSDTKSAVRQAESLDVLEVTITSPASDITIRPGDSVSFAGQATGGSGTYSYAWEIPGGATTSSLLASPGAVQFSVTGTYTVTFTVTDSDGVVGIDTVVVTVSDAGGTLEATITSPFTDPYEIVTTAGGGAETLNLVGIATGGSGGYTYYWDIPGGTPTTSTAQSLTVTFANKGVYLITFTVTDSAGHVAEDTVTVNGN